ncbi:hypothetical protein FGO68_gene10408 [Halteria grandinella]|uniref:Uncharacterized protein n=1 Tax=Halteria grandinella TaxID=5974 RepID=A0A8J8T614_HALGN|nr:hypothetical protein FGO68_gene10408 [Halteria grandinella]
MRDIANSLYGGSIEWEFIVQAIPCYILLVTSIYRLYQIKDHGQPRQMRYGWQLSLKLLLSAMVILLRILQIFHHFSDLNDEDLLVVTDEESMHQDPIADVEKPNQNAPNQKKAWLQRAGYQSQMSLLYLQFILAQGLSIYLLQAQHFKGHDQVWYCHRLFWGLSALGSVSVIKFSVDGWYSLLLDFLLFSISLGLFVLDFYPFKCRCIRNTSDLDEQSERLMTISASKDQSGTRQTINGEGGSVQELSEIQYFGKRLKKMRDLTSIDGGSKKIDFLFKSKLSSNQGTLMFEFKVFLPISPLPQQASIQDNEATLQSLPLGFHTGEYQLKKSLKDFIDLSNHLAFNFGQTAPKLDKQLFSQRTLKSERTRMMQKSIKHVESFMKRVGRSQCFWEDQFLHFLQINDPATIQYLTSQESPNKSSTIGSQLPRDSIIVKQEENQETHTELFHEIHFIDNYESLERSQACKKTLTGIVQTQTELLTITHHNTFSEIKITEQRPSIVEHHSKKLKVSVSGRSWIVVRTISDWEQVLLFHKVKTCHQLETQANIQSPTLDLLLFIDYFQSTTIDATEHLYNLLSTSGYRVLSVSLKSTQIEINSTGQSSQVFTIEVTLTILSMKREELIILKKSFKDIKRFIKSVKRDLDAFQSFSVLSSIEIPDAKREEDLYHQMDLSPEVLVDTIEQLLQQQDIRQLDATCWFLSREIQSRYARFVSSNENSDQSCDIMRRSIDKSQCSSIEISFDEA